jgi:hypothetical protein
MTVQVGQTRQLSATVRNVPAGADGGVDFTSSATGIASVDPAGAVTGVAPGTATITATARADASADATSTITVVAAPAAIAIASIVNAATGQQVDAQNVADSIRVVMTTTFSPGAATRAEVTIDDAVACTRSVTGTGGATSAGQTAAAAVVLAQLQVICPINTSQLDTAAANRGNPVFPNGPHTLSARLISPTGNVVASSASQQLLFNNQDRIELAVTTTRGPALSNTGLTWRGGDLTVTATPAIFSGANARIATVTIQAAGAGVNTARADTTAADGFSVAFPADAAPPDGLDGVQTELTITAQTVTVGGAPGLTPGPITIRMDNAAPGVGQIILPANFWINGSFQFNDNTFTTPPDDFNGVNRVTTAFFFTPTGSTTRTPVTRPQDMPQTTRADTLTLSADVLDDLRNATRVTAARAVGNDYTPATLRADTLNPELVLDGSVNRGSTFAVTVSDAHSGVAQVQSAIEHITPALNFCYVGNDANGCTPAPGPTSFAAPTFDGYYRFTVNALDVAGNATGNQVIVTSLRDAASPGLANPTVSAPPYGGAGFSISTSVTDNLDLRYGSLFQCFDFAGQSGCVPRAQTSLGTFGPDAFTTSANLTFPNVTDFIRSFEFTVAATNAPQGTQYRANRIGLDVVDQAGRGRAHAIDLPAVQVQPAGPSFGGSVQTLQMTAPAAGATVGNGAAGAPACAAGVATSIPMTVDVIGALGFANPFKFVLIYRVDPQGVPRFVADLTQSTRVDAASSTTYRFTGTFDATGLPVQNNAPLSALGVSAAGDGLKARDVAVNITRCR